MIPTKVLYFIFFYITLCMADAETHQQLGNNGTLIATINVTIGNDTYTNVTVTNITNASNCDIVLDLDDIEYDRIVGTYYYYVPGEGSYYFWVDDDDSSSSGTYNDGSSSSGTYNDGNHKTNDNDHKRSRRHYRSSNGDNDHSESDDDWSAFLPVNFTVGNTTFCVNKTRSNSNSNTNDNDHHRGGRNNDHHNGGHRSHRNRHHSNDNDHGNNPSPNPTPNPAPIDIIIINVTNNNGTVVVNTSVISDGNVTTTTTTAAFGDDSHNNFPTVDAWGNDARHVQMRDDLINKKSLMETQLDNEIQKEGITAQRKSDLEIILQKNIMKISTIYLYTQGATEDDKQKTCDALTNTAESFSNLKYSDCDFNTITNYERTSKRQAGDYFLISTYSVESGEQNSGMALSLSLIAIFIAFLSYNF